jgi:polysaccharide biosynthesis protein PslH
MRVVLVCPMPPAAAGHGAIPRLLHAQVIGLAARHEVTVITVAGPEEWELDAVRDLRRTGIDVRAALRPEPVGRARWERRVRLAHRWVVRGLPWRTSWFWEPSLQGAIDRRLAEGWADVVHGEDNAVALYRIRGARCTVLTELEVRRPRRLAVAALLGRDAPRRVLAELDWRRWRGYQRRAWARFDRIQVFTERDATSLSLIAPELAPRVRVNPFGVEIPRACRLEDEEPGRVLFVGNYTHQPNVDAVIWLVDGVMPRLRASVPAARLWVVGARPPEAVRALAGPAVEVAGSVADVRPFMERAQIVLAPVRTGGGMRMKVLEAMAAGKAVVTTARGAAGLGPDAPLRIAETPEGIAEAAASLMADPAGRAALGAAARRFAIERHSPDAHVRGLEAIYEDALAHPGVVVPTVAAT